MELNLSAIYIYPVKSLPAVPVETARAGDLGLQGDRRWMLCDDNGRFISLREEKKMTRFRIAPASDAWQIGWENDSVIIPRELQSGDARRVTIWEDEVNVLAGKPEWDAWFSDKLGRTCQLVYRHDGGSRLVKERWRTGTEEVSFADGYPYLLVGESSLKALESETGQTLDILRFRPNLVVSGDAPYAEFTYRQLQVGEAVLNGLKPCERCVVTTIDPATGQQGKEPLRTLARSRVEGKVVFGQHASLYRPGTINTGDKVIILRHKESPYESL